MVEFTCNCHISSVRVKDQYSCIVPRVTCDGVDANAEQVKRGMTSAYRKYAMTLICLCYSMTRRWRNGAGWFGTLLFRHTLSVEHKVKHEDNYEEV